MKTTKFFAIFYLIFVFTNSCGYTPIYSSTNLEIKFNKIDYVPNILNQQIAQTLTSLSNINGKKEYDLELKTFKEKNIVSKNSKGDTETYEIKIILELVVNNNDIEDTQRFSSKVKYNNNDNKFELNQYEIEIEKQIINGLIEEIILYFSKL